MTEKTLLNYKTVSAELLEMDGDSELHVALLALLRKGEIEATRNEAGKICFRAIEPDEKVRR